MLWRNAGLRAEIDASRHELDDGRWGGDGDQGSNGGGGRASRRLRRHKLASLRERAVAQEVARRWYRRRYFKSLSGCVASTLWWSLRNWSD